jgi:hypothetical protein
VQAAIGRDAVKPGAQRRSPVEELKPAQGGLAVQLELPTVRVDELAERRLVSRAGAGKRSLGYHGILAWRFVPAPSGV